MKLKGKVYKTVTSSVVWCRDLGNERKRCTTRSKRYETAEMDVPSDKGD